VTKPYAEVIGDPIAHSKSPLIHNFWLGKLGIDAEYRACHVKPEDLADYFAKRRGDAAWRGCNVTIPHKLAALDFVDDSGAMVAAVGATNCIFAHDGLLRADNTDIYGVGDAIPADANSVCVMGAGGAARAALAALDQAGAKDVRILARDPAKAEASLSNLFHRAPGHEWLRYFALDEAPQAMADTTGVINASPMGMIGQAAMPPELLDAIALTQAEAFVFDMVYSPLHTPFLAEGSRLGRRPIDGLVMLVTQAAYAFRMFFGVHPDPDGKFDAELRALLTA
jgi:shikimate dehydrogenase